MVTDRVGDFIIRLQNAAMVGKEEVRVPHSAHLLAVAQKLKQLGFVSEVSTEKSGDSDVKKDIVLTLAYDANGNPRVRGVKRVSKPGRRLYAPHTGAHNVKGGTGARILTTSKGIMSDVEARKNKVGGEDLFEIW